MMRLLRLLSLLFLCVFTARSQAQSIVCHVTGRVDDPREKEVMLFETFSDIRNGHYKKVPVKQGKFACDIRTDKLKGYYVVLTSEYENGTMRVANFIIEPANVHITIPRATDDGDDVIRISSRGPENTMAMRYIAFRDSLFKAYEPRLQSLETTPPAAADTSREERQEALSVKQKYEQISDEMGLEKAEWIASHVCFYSLSRIMNDLSVFAPPRTRDRLTEIYYEKFARFMPSHPYHESILQVAAALQLKPGRKYVDYLVPDERGRDVMLSSLYQGKLIYINLWASWCGSCRRHAKSLIPLYNKYKDRGFQIISFARETRKGAMEEAEEREGYPWKSQVELNDRHQIWLRNGLGDAGGGGYLIDNDGTILAVYPSADELEAILKRRL